jgi:DNA repair protein RadC
MEIDFIGHRHRLRERFEKTYAAGMHDYEVLELLLTYGIPRRDVKPIAKNLLQKFGNLNGVLDASLEELKLVHSLGTYSSVLIKLVKEINALYLAGRMAQQDVLVSPQRVVDFSRMKLAGLPHEAFMAIFLSTQNQVIGHEVVNEGTVDQVAVYPRRIIERALVHHAAALIIVHNHPSGFTDPSEEDKNLTRTLRNAASVLDIRLLDHLIVGKGGHFSFVERGLL